MIRGVAFDFDGVLVESGNIKTEAFAQMFRPFGAEIEKKVVAHHLEHGGISRYKKVRYYYETYLQRSISQAEVDQICEQFSQLVVQKVIQAPLVQGIENFLQQNQLPLFIISGTPEQELKEIVQQRQMQKYFQRVYGSPQLKEIWLQTILDDYQWLPHELVFIGDSQSDYHSAHKVGVHFIGRISDPAIHFEGLPQVAFVLSDLTSLPSCLQKLS